MPPGEEPESTKELNVSKGTVESAITSKKLAAAACAQSLSYFTFLYLFRVRVKTSATTN
jgi:hypothetical protein